MTDVTQRPDVTQLVADLAAEQRDLDEMVACLSPEDWSLPTPAQGWDVRDQIGHLAYFDERAVHSITAPEEFAAARRTLVAGADVAAARSLSASEVLEWWRRARGELLEATADLDPRTRLRWYGPDMGALSFVTARLMETWAHGQDVADGLGVGRPATARLRHIAELGLRTRAWSYRLHGMAPPDSAVRLELLAPGGGTWVLGDEIADDLVRGSALDFCLVVCQRRHMADTDLVATGPHAIEWLAIAQCFAGDPGTGRRPGEFA